MVIFYCIVDQKRLKIHLHDLQCNITLPLYKCSGNKRSNSRLGLTKQKPMLDVKINNYLQIPSLQSHIETRGNNLKVKTAFHMSSKHNNQIDRTQKTNEENGRQATREDRKRTKLFTKLPKFCRSK